MTPTQRRKLEAALAEKVLGWTPESIGKGNFAALPRYTESIADAIALLEAEDCTWDIERGVPGETGILVSIDVEGEWVCGRSDESVALALCLALAAKYNIPIEEEPADA